MASFESMTVEYRRLLPAVCLMRLHGATLLSSCGAAAPAGRLYCPYSASVAGIGNAARALTRIAEMGGKDLGTAPAAALTSRNTNIWNIRALRETHLASGAAPGTACGDSGQAARMTLVGFASDGFPIYALWGHATATDASSKLRIMTSSYRLRVDNAPSGTAVPKGGGLQDYEYIAGLGDLDERNGRFGVTPEFPSGIYHYYITDSHPCLQGCTRDGTADRA